MNTTHHAVLFALFDLAKYDRHATIGRLVEHPAVMDLGLDRAAVLRALAALDKAGLADHERVRLTMNGLPLALVLGAPKTRRNTVRRAA